MIGSVKRWIGRVLGRGGSDAADRVYGATHVGRKRKANEDFFLIHKEKNLFIAADGMGGHNAGEVASLNAAKHINQYFSFKVLSEIAGDGDQIRKRMCESLAGANRKLREMARVNKGYRGMGCTVVMALIEGDDLHLCHVGDSRAYLCNRSGIQLLTTDHSYVMGLVAAGKMTPEEARHSNLKNELTQAIGAMQTIKPDYNCRSLKEGDRLLLCSDGLWDMLSDEEIYRVTRKNRPAQAICDELIEKANTAGGKDNITAVLVIHRRNRRR
jgi:protein phosphatase